MNDFFVGGQRSVVIGSDERPATVDWLLTTDNERLTN